MDEMDGFLTDSADSVLNIINDGQNLPNVHMMGMAQIRMIAALDMVGQTDAQLAVLLQFGGLLPNPFPDLIFQQNRDHCTLGS